jgi:hypothetical protein
LETNPGRFIPESERTLKPGTLVRIDLNQPMPAILARSRAIR